MSGQAAPFWGWPGWRHLGFATWVSALGVIWFAVIYGGADSLTAHRAARVRVHFDAELGIPFVPEAVLVYMSIYLLFVAAPFIVRERREFLTLALTLDFAILIAGIFFLLVPAQLAFPPPVDLGALPGLFRLADRLNLTYNLFPSLHVALSTACVAVYARRAPRWGKCALWLWAAAVGVSTLLTHQHHILDVVGGAALGLTGFKWIYLRYSA